MIIRFCVKNPPAVKNTQETRVQSLNQEDPLEKQMATLSNILAWRSPLTEEPSGLHPWGCKEWDTTEHALETENTFLYAYRFVLLVALQYIFLITPK